MFAVIYQFYLKPHQEKIYLDCWDKVVKYFKGHCGALGSCLHKGENGLWVAYSRWPDRATRDAVWNKDNSSLGKLPHDIQQAIIQMHKFKEENSDLENYGEICLEVVNDLFLGK